MTDSSPDLSLVIFGKTSLGQQEIQSRTLGLAAMSRRLLILIDGKRKFQEFSTLVGGHDLLALLNDLQSKGCIEAVANLSAAPAAPPPAAVQSATASSSPAATGAADHLIRLPAAQTRSAKEIDMARHFMMNTINTVFQQNTRLTLLEAIHACKTAEELRLVYLKWAETMQGSSIGAKRLPEFREMLFKVL